MITRDTPPTLTTPITKRAAWAILAAVVLIMCGLSLFAFGG